MYAYGAPGIGGETVTEAKMELYAQAGFNRILLFGSTQCAWESSVWETNKRQAEATVEAAWAEGIEQFIIRDTGLEALTTSTWASKTDDEIKTQIRAYFNRYLTWKIDGKYVITGVDLGDEPKGSSLEQYGRVYKLVKAVAKESGYNRSDLEIYVCLLPAYGGTDMYTLDGAAVSEENRYSAYRTYVKTFLEKTDATKFVVDVYPFEAKTLGLVGYLKEGYYATLQIVAEEATAADAQYGFVLQSTGESSRWRTVNEALMALQTNSAIGFGATEIGFFRYMPTSSATNSDAYFVETDGVTTNDVYEYAKEQLTIAQSFASIILSFEYNASALYGSSSERYFENYAVGFENDEFEIAEVSFSEGMGLATELYDSVNGLYAYMLQNVLDTVYGTATTTITATFEGYTRAAVIIDGEVSYVDLEDGVYTVSLSNGQAVYVIPLA